MQTSIPSSFALRAASMLTRISRSSRFICFQHVLDRCVIVTSNRDSVGKNIFYLLAIVDGACAGSAFFHLDSGFLKRCFKALRILLDECFRVPTLTLSRHIVVEDQIANIAETKQLLESRLSIFVLRTPPYMDQMISTE
jgi:hypothetical protein